MPKTIPIRQEEWDSPFLTFARQDSLSYFVNLSSLFASSPVIVDQQPLKCKHCKSFPFSMSGVA
jgi:hypothetical protein